MKVIRFFLCLKSCSKTVIYYSLKLKPAFTTRFFHTSKELKQTVQSGLSYLIVYIVNIKTSLLLFE